jgi:hypothetical protein
MRRRGSCCARTTCWIRGRKNHEFHLVGAFEVPIQLSNSQDVCHCEPTGRANARPMTGSAKQSIAPRKGRMDCFVAALLAMTSLHFQIRLRILAARCARGLPRTSGLLKFRGRRECRVPNAPAASRANVKWHTSVVTTVTPEIARHSPRNGFTAYAMLSPATNSCCHRHRRIKARQTRSSLISPPPA